MGLWMFLLNSFSSYSNDSPRSNIWNRTCFLWLFDILQISENTLLELCEMKFRILLSAPGVLESVLFVVVATLLNTDPRPFFVGKTTTERLCWKELWLLKGRQKVNGMLTRSFLENLQPPIYKLSVSSKCPACLTWIFWLRVFDWFTRQKVQTLGKFMATLFL